MKHLEKVAVRPFRIYSMVVLALFAALTLVVAAPRAAAQNDGGVAGTILTIEGKPWVGLTMQLVNEQGAKQETKTGNDGGFAFRNLRTGIYHVFAMLPEPNKPYDTQLQVQGGTVTRADLNFKDIVAHQGAASQEAVKKQAEQKAASEQMKTHFTAGSTLLDQEHTAKAELAKAPADQRDADKQKISDLANQAATEFQAAQKAAGEKDPNQALFWAKLGDVYDTAGRNDDAIQAYQQAITAKPEVPGYYNNLGNVLARSGKIDEAKTAYEKSAALDPPNAASAWRNFGYSLYNAQRLPDAVEPLQKSVALEPNNAQTWFYLGTALLSKMTTTRVGTKDQPTFAPGTIEAFQKAQELDPSGPWGAQAKETLTALQAMAPGIDITVSNKKKKS
jgi:tetratricopeptide (TPR) repeat protein